jgi:hypothetical protein
VGFEIVYQKAEKNENNKIDFMEIECEKWNGVNCFTAVFGEIFF